MQLILASGSPRRQELLRLVTPDFLVQPVNIDESIPDTIAPEDASAYLARKKAQAAARQFPDSIVLGADTTVLLGNQILGKPRTPEHAAEMLRLLSGKTHKVITGVALAEREHMESFCTKTLVTFYPLSEAEIRQYVATGEPLDKAGSYGIQGYGALLAERIEGDYYGIVGLPIAPLARMLRTWNEKGGSI